MYEDIFDAKNAFENLSGFNVANRYYIKKKKKLDIWLCCTTSHKKCKKDRTKNSKEDKLKNYGSNINNRILNE